MLNQLIRWSLENRWLVMVLAVGLTVVGGVVIVDMPLDVFPELKAPTVTVMTEAPGYAAEEVEVAVTFPIETSLNGLPGIRRVRSSSAIGLSIVWAEFDFNADVYRSRQLIAERLAQVQDVLPENIHPPEMTPISSITGEVMLLALSTKEGATLSPLELRRTAEFDLRTRLLAVPGIAQVTAIGGELPEFQVEARPDDLLRYGLTLKDVEDAVADAHAPVAGGYLPNVRGRELPIKPITRARRVEDLSGTVVGDWKGTPVVLSRIADVELGGAPKRGTGSSQGRDAVVLAIQKNPGVNTLTITAAIDAALDDFEKTMPDGMVLDRFVFRQADFIEVAIHNVLDALRDGTIFVALILFLFLLNLRTTFITLTALPLSIGITLIVLYLFDASINVMTLGGIAVAIGSLVDDAIVDVENVFRRLRENAGLPPDARKPVLRVVYQASVEVRSSIFLATLVIVLVFVPLFFLSGVEGRFFRPLGASYVISLAASLLVAMTVTPVLCWLLLGRARVVERGEGAVVRMIKSGYAWGLGLVLRFRWTVLGLASLLVVGALALGLTFGSSFLPDFNEGSITLFLNLPPGTSLSESARVTRNIENQVKEIPGVTAVTRRTGRAEQDEHAEPVSSSELDVRLAPDADATEVRRRLVALFRATPGVTSQIGGPIAHRLSHILSGTPAAVAIKIFGDDLDVLRQIAQDVEGQLQQLPGIQDLVANREVMIDTLPIAFDRGKLASYGLTPGEAARQIETAFRGRTVSVVNEGGARYDVVVRLAENARQDPEHVGLFLLRSPSGARVRVRTVADLREERASNLITRENVKRKAVVSCNVAEGENLGDLIAAIKQRVDPIIARHPRTFVEYGGQFEAQEAASSRILWASLGVLVVICMVLFASFRSARPVLLILLNLPLALVGGVLALFIADSPNVFANLSALFGSGTYVAPIVSIASVVGFIGLAGVACRNGLLLISHYHHLLESEGVDRREAVVRASKERLVPILMTALSSALALIPLVMRRGEIGSELQYPLAVVILGGLISSTFLNLAVIPVGLDLFGAVRSPRQGNSINDFAQEPVRTDGP
ncbi:MAG: CusA/CzcA family heavy metal efflux RND transporter [Planctomycetes bacterium]|nr:CusA/CzcA family heavy metal efflux RND transporter [Planctomycetota bacterium]